jgi:type VI secretion system protein VasJ
MAEETAAEKAAGSVLGEQLEKITRPFKGKQPYGININDDDLLFELQMETDKLTAASSAETKIDWKAIKKLSITILTTKSKDLMVTSYLVLALFVVDGYAGVRDGLEVLRKLVKEDWEGVYPALKLKRMRIAVFEWLVMRLGPLVADREPAKAELEHVQPIADLVEEINEAVSEHLGYDAPSFGELLGAITTRVAELPKPPSPEPEAQPAEPAAQPAAAAPAAEPPTPAAPQPQPAAAPQPPPQPQTQAKPAPAAAPVQPQLIVVPAPDESASNLRAQLLAYVAPLRQADPLDPTPYRLLRSLKWDNLAGPPAADPSTGKTNVPPPKPQRRKALNAFLEGQRWQELLHASEGAFQEPSGIFWLDLQYYSMIALEHLDPAGADGKAAQLICDEVGRFMERFSAIKGYTFADEQPMASETTREWLSEVMSRRGSSTMAVIPAADSGPEGSVIDQDEANQALQLFAKKQPAAAFSILQGAIGRAANLRSRFRTSLTASRICLQANQDSWAKTLLEELFRQAEAVTFEVWQPEAAIELHQLLAICYGRLAKNRKTANREAMQSRFESHVERLFQLDMQAAAAVHEQV